jgi:hypothetical protein
MPEHTSDPADVAVDWPFDEPGNSEFSPRVPAFAPSPEPGALKPVILGLQEITPAIAAVTNTPATMRTFFLDFHEFIFLIF